MTISEQKQRLRAEIRRLEQELSAEYKETADERIVQRLTALPEYRTAHSVFCFVGTEREINTMPLLRQILAAGKRLLLPLCTGPGVMELRQITSLSQLEKGAYGILEPKRDTPVVSKTQVDLAVIPCVSCDRAGHRLGQGGGYYDRFFEGHEIPAVLICREALMCAQIPTQTHDVVFPTVVTETAVYR